MPLEQWYGTCFAGVLTHQSIIRIWDKICGGSRKIVVFVFVTIFNWIWRTTKASSATQVSEILTIIDNVSCDYKHTHTHNPNHSNPCLTRQPFFSCWLSLPPFSSWKRTKKVLTTSWIIQSNCGKRKGRVLNFKLIELLKSEIESEREENNLTKQTKTKQHILYF